jgi:hypothetical protein
MPEPVWVTYKETTHGVNGDGYADIFNRVERTLWTHNFLAEHNKDGTHKFDISLSGWGIETGVYVGTGAGTTKEIYLVNASNTPKFFRGLSAATAYTLSASYTHAYAMSSGGILTATPVLMSVGTVTVTGDLNILFRTYHYAIYSCYVVEEGD